MDRRLILKTILAGLAIPLAPISIANAAQANGRRLILVELSGANDGLNTVVPFNDERYREIRPNICLSSQDLFNLTNELALHKSLIPLDAAWQAGEMAIIQGLGYPGQNRSHFKSIALWETGGDGSKSGPNGWLTEDIEGMEGVNELDAHGISLDGGMGIFASSSGVWLSMTSLNQFIGLRSNENQPQTIQTASSGNPALALLMDRGRALDKSMERISSKLSRISTSSDNLRFEAGDLGRQAAIAAQLIDAGIDAPILKLKIDGFDTHELQQWQHSDLLRDLGRALAGLREALIRSGHWESTLIMTYSEFGRRAVENESLGTDHGTAAPHFLLGGSLKGGIWGMHPDLGALEDGDMQFTMDYRSAYHRVLCDWFGIENNRFTIFANESLNGIFQS
jgi:uncharacterized protein (DUF1501 family)